MNNKEKPKIELVFLNQDVETEESFDSFINDISSNLADFRNKGSKYTTSHEVFLDEVPFYGSDTERVSFRSVGENELDIVVYSNDKTNNDRSEIIRFKEGKLFFVRDNNIEEVERNSDRGVGIAAAINSLLGLANIIIDPILK